MFDRKKKTAPRKKNENDLLQKNKKTPARHGIK